MSQPHRSEFRLLHRLRVRWAEIDLQRIVFNPHYLMYIDTAFTAYWRAMAMPYESIPALLGGDLSALASATVVCIGPIVAETARELGLPPHVVAEEHTIEGMVAALRAYIHSTSTPRSQTPVSQAL